MWQRPADVVPMIIKTDDPDAASQNYDLLNQYHRMYYRPEENR
jgi:hypothetical protein